MEACFFSWCQVQGCGQLHILGNNCNFKQIAQFLPHIKIQQLYFFHDRSYTLKTSSSACFHCVQSKIGFISLNF